MLPHVDFFLPNDDEAGRLTGESNTQRQARQLLRYGCDTVVITMGERGALLMNRRETIEMPAFVTQVVDPSGAGDAFAAGVIVGVLEKWEMARTLRFANATGASRAWRWAATRVCSPGHRPMPFWLKAEPPFHSSSPLNDLFWRLAARPMRSAVLAKRNRHRRRRIPAQA